MRGPAETGVEGAISNGLEWVRLGIEAIGAAVVVIGIVCVLVQMAQTRDSRKFSQVRLSLAQFLALALEFQLAADILSTAIAPTWDKIGKLVVIAIIRTALNYFLMKEMSEDRIAAGGSSKADSD
jgi:uncharacterized membrane protein